MIKPSLTLRFDNVLVHKTFMNFLLNVELYQCPKSFVTKSCIDRYYDASLAQKNIILK